MRNWEDHIASEEASANATCYEHSKSHGIDGEGECNEDSACYKDCPLAHPKNVDECKHYKVSRGDTVCLVKDDEYSVDGKCRCINGFSCKNWTSEVHELYESGICKSIEDARKLVRERIGIKKMIERQKKNGTYKERTCNLKRG